MSTQIIDQKYFKDNNNSVYVIDVMPMNEKTWQTEIQDGWIEITKEEADLIANPPPTQQEIDAKKVAENIAFLSSETRRTNDAIELLDDAIEFDMATEDEIYRHKELRKYRIELMRVKDHEGYPLKADFPTCPDFFSE